MSTVYLLRYNNYYNRVVKKEVNLASYQQYLVGSVDDNGDASIIENYNFIENDYVNTTAVFNWTGLMPDYIIVAEGTEIKSRWFITEIQKQNFAQIKVFLHRDVVVDFYNSVVNSPAFIERGTPASQSDPSIFNNEDMSFNQIKQFEAPIKDELGIPWIVGYMPQDALPEGKTVTIYGDETVDKTISGNGTSQSVLQNWDLYEYTNFVWNGDVNNIKKIKLYPHGLDFYFWVGTTYNGYKYEVGFKFDFINYRVSFAYFERVNSYSHACIIIKDLFQTVDVTDTEVNPYGQPIFYNEVYHQIGVALVKACYAHPFDVTGYASIDEYLADINNLVVVPDTALGTQKTNPDLYNEFMQTNGSTIEFKGSDDTRQIFHFQSQSESLGKPLLPVVQTINMTTATFPTIVNTYIDNLIQEMNKIELYSPDPSNPNTWKIQLHYLACQSKNYQDYLLWSNVAGEISFTIPPADERQHMLNQPYDMFAIPYTYSASTMNMSKISEETQMEAAIQITSQVGSDNIYDVQIVPYCPLRNRLTLKDDGTYYIDAPALISKTEGFKEAIPIINPHLTGSDKSVGVIFFCNSADGSFKVKSPKIVGFDSILSKKISNETDLYRLCSPNYASSFDFSAAKNGGLRNFNIDFLYTPFSPFIHVAPDFSELYGSDFNDARGLTCGDDLALPQRSSAWVDYQVQNKNYQLMFNRQIENLEVQNNVERTKQNVQIAAGTVAGAAGGAGLGSKIGGWIGGLFGGIAGAGVSAAAGAADYNASETLRRENLDYTKDQFRMQMQNIKALPSTITKGNILAPTFKIFPFLEYYTCTAEEKTALTNKIQYEGMRIDRIGTFGQYINPDSPYLQGYLIRLYDAEGNTTEEGLTFNIMNAINEELKQGVYIS